MVESVQISTQKKILLESDMLGTLIISYIFLALILFVSFINIYSVDKYEFLYNKQKCIEFKHKMLFIIMYSKEKHIVAIKTFLSEVIGYLLSIILITVFLYSLNREVTISFILLGIMTLLTFSFGWITGSMYQKTKKYK